MNIDMELVRESILSLLIYAHIELGLPADESNDLPVIKFVSTKQLEKLACENFCKDIKGWTTANNLIYLNNNLDFNFAYDKSIMLHELVHHLQYKYSLNQHSTDCITWKSREAQAFEIQIGWLQKTHSEYNTLRVNQVMRNFHRIQCPIPSEQDT